MPALQFTVLGGLDVQIDSETVDLGTRKQRALLAQLVLADGDAVSTDRLIEGIWGDAPPDRAAASLQAYVSGLRKTLEPHRKPRAPATVVLTRGTSYLLVVDDDAVDLRRLKRLIAAAQTHHQAGEIDSAAPLLVEALASYRPLLPEFAGMEFREEAARQLDRLLAAAQELSFEARLHSGDLRLLVGDLEEAVGRAPLDEGLWALLATARYRLGRQSAALDAIAQARRILQSEIGVDPGPRLTQLERDILRHAPELDARPGSPVATPVDPPAVAAGDPVAPSASPAAARLIGRSSELAVLHRATVASLSGPGGVIIVEGEPGVGKTALIEEAGLRAAEAGDVQVFWGRCVRGSAAPSMWPWVQVLSGALLALSEDRRTQLLDSDLGRMVTQGATVVPPPREMPDAAARFRFYGQAADLLVGIAESLLLIVVIDDLQWADSASLELLVHMVARRAPGVTFLVSVRSSTEHRPSVTSTLAELARLPDHHRISLGPLTNDDIAQILRREIQQWPSAEAVEAIATRTGGNAFFVRELARIMADPSNGAASGSTDFAIPAGVRDVVAERLRPLPDATRELLEVATFIGSTVDITLLAEVADRPVSDVLDDLDQVAALALITSTPEDPYTFAFGHDLIREVIADMVPAARTRRIHLAIADRVESGAHANSPAQLAHHLWAAGPLADRSRTAYALLRAGADALRSYNFDVGTAQLSDAARLARAIGDVEVELRADYTQLASIVSRNGYFAVPDDLRERTRELAENIDPALLANLDYARCAAHSQIADIANAHRYAVDMLDRATSTGDARATRMALQANAIDAFDQGNLGRAYELFAEHVPARGPIADFRPDQAIIARGFRGFAATIHRGVGEGRALFEEIETGAADPVSFVGIAVFAASAGAYAGDAEWVLQVGERLLTPTDHATLDYLRSSGERMYWWARVMVGDHEEGLERIAAMHDVKAPDRTGLGFWRGLYAEAMLAAGRLDDVGPLLSQAAEFAARTGQRYPDSHRLFVQARFARAGGAGDDAVRRLLETARRTSVDHGATVITTRVDEWAAEQGLSLPD